VFFFFFEFFFFFVFFFHGHINVQRFRFVVCFVKTLIVHQRLICYLGRALWGRGLCGGVLHIYDVSPPLGFWEKLFPFFFF